MLYAVLAGAVIAAAAVAAAPVAVAVVVVDFGSAESTAAIQAALPENEAPFLDALNGALFGAAEKALACCCSTRCWAGGWGEGIFQEFTSSYDEWNYDDRDTCVLSKDVIGELECLVVGTSILSQADGQPMTVPLPPLGSA